MLPEMLMFQKFGILIMSVVAFSLLFAMTYFIPLLAAFGPENDTGYVPVREWFTAYISDPMRGVFGYPPKDTQEENDAAVR